MDDILKKITKWSEKEDSIRALILLRSRARLSESDTLSDYDIAVFCTNTAFYTENEDWLKEVGKVWVCIKESLSFNESTFPSRLVIFEGGVKIDFSFFPLDILKTLTQKEILPEEYQRGYLVFLDKDHLACNLKKPLFKKPQVLKPSEDVFLRVIEEFWFEAYHVAIYLKREDLFSVKFRSNAMQSFLLKMIEWEYQAQNGWQYLPFPIGKQMASWTNKNTWKAMHSVFAHFDTKDSWDALFHTLKLFRSLSKELSKDLGFLYPESLDNHISSFILSLHEKSQC